MECPGDGTCSSQGTCDDTIGNCVCNEGYEGDMCQGNKGIPIPNRVCHSVTLSNLTFDKEEGNLLVFGVNFTANIYSYVTTIGCVMFATVI